MQALQRQGVTPRSIADLEEVLADPDVDAVIVASGPALRPAQLRRAVQSECHVLCVHPADPSPDLAYEIALIQADTGRVLLPLLPLTFHPGLEYLAEPMDKSRETARSNDPVPRLLELEIWSAEEVLLEADIELHKPGLPGWDALRFLGGEISEIHVLSSGEELTPGRPCLISGRFLAGGMFQATHLPNQAHPYLRLSLVTAGGRRSLIFDEGWPGPARWFEEGSGDSVGPIWPASNPWIPLIEHFEQAVAQSAGKKPLPGQPAGSCLTKPPVCLGWQDEWRALELDDAARRSAERGRGSTLDFQEATEEAGFKGTMTLLGCSLIWLSLIVLILAVWMPVLVWFILPVFGLFLVMQTLRWVLPPKMKDET